jgi:hypothetical protein
MLTRLPRARRRRKSEVRSASRIRFFTVWKSNSDTEEWEEDERCRGWRKRDERVESARKRRA